MKIYLVGGAVRDRLLGLPVKEKDWVVVGATIHDMQKLGFRQVGKDFPVFLHPVTQEEYALARVERKIGRGYKGFLFDTGSTVTLEEDLKRRDITINAMAEDSTGTIIDPFQGQADLKNKLLRHISPAFAEDPVRILRLARFAARFNFAVAESTYALMQDMVTKGEVDALVPERVWKEFERALGENYPEQFFKVLSKAQALNILFPEIVYPGKGINALLKATGLSPNPLIRFAALLHENSADNIANLCRRYRIPTIYKEAAMFVSKHLTLFKEASRLSAEKLLDFLLQADAFRRKERFITWLTACDACQDCPQSMFFLQAFEIAQSIHIEDFTKNLSGKEIAQKIKMARLDALKNWLKSVK